MEDLKIVNADNLLYTSLDETDITPQYLTKLLNEYSKTILLDNKICFKTSRTSTSRLVNLKKDIDGNDDDDGKNIPQESSLKEVQMENLAHNFCKKCSVFTLINAIFEN